MSAQEPKQQQLPPAPPLPQPSKPEPWFEQADKNIKARRQDLNNKFLILRRSSRGSEEVKASLKTIIQELKDLTAVSIIIQFLDLGPMSIGFWHQSKF